MNIMTYTFYSKQSNNISNLSEWGTKVRTREPGNRRRRDPIPASQNSVHWYIKCFLYEALISSEFLESSVLPLLLLQDHFGGWMRSLCSMFGALSCRALAWTLFCRWTELWHVDWLHSQVSSTCQCLARFMGILSNSNTNKCIPYPLFAAQEKARYSLHHQGQALWTQSQMFWP